MTENTLMTESAHGRWVCHTHRGFGESYYTAHHPCGLTLVLYPKARTTCYAALGVRYGSLHRRGGSDCPNGCQRCTGECPGMAHFLEHKMFELPDGGDADNLFASLGANVNAYTTYDSTTYQFSGDADGFAAALTVLLRLIDDLHITDASVERERSIIAEEIRMDMDDPWDACAGALLKALYRCHPIREEICGTLSSITHITADRLRRVFRERYALPDMVLSVSGAVTPECVWDTVDKALTGREASPGMAAPPVTAEEPAEVFRNRIALEMPVARPLFCLGIKDPNAPVDSHGSLMRDVCMSLLGTMLFSETGAIYTRLYEAGLISQETSYSTTCGRGYGFLAMQGETDDPEAVYSAFLACVDSLRATGLSREEFERFRRVRYADLVTGFDAAEDVAESLLSCALDGQELFDCMSAAESVTFADVSRLFEEIFRPAQYAMAVIHPAAELPYINERK